MNLTTKLKESVCAHVLENKFDERSRSFEIRRFR